MKNNNSRRNNPSRCNHKGIIRFTSESGILQESYPFQLTDEFRVRFDGDPSVRLPSAFNLSFWRKHTGDPAWEIELACVQAKNKEALENYDKKVLEINCLNAKREQFNREQDRVYAEAMQKYRETIASLDARRKHERIEATRHVKYQAVLDLETAVHQQSNIIDKLIEQVRESVLEKLSGRFEYTLSWLFLGLGILTSATAFGSSLCSTLAYLCRCGVNADARRMLARELTNVNQFARGGQPVGPRYKFLIYQSDTDMSDSRSICTPAIFTKVPYYKSSKLGADILEEHPLGQYCYDEFDDLPSLRLLLLYAIPVLGLFANIFTTELQHDDLRSSLAIHVKPDEIKRNRLANLKEILSEQLESPEVLNYLVDRYLAKTSTPIPENPQPPKEPSFEEPLPLPTRPVLSTPKNLSAPSWCYDTTEKQDFSHILKGSLIYKGDQVSLLARYRLFADDCARPYFKFGDVPIPRLFGGSPHYLIVGTSGSGKTTSILKLMSSRLPLTKSQAAKVEARSRNPAERLPESSEEWSRSYTHQAVVYNAKGEYLNHLRAFGFDQNVDLFSLDPADPNGYAWDLATDIDDRESIQQFSEQLIPQSASANRDKNHEFWLGTARSALEAAIVSFRNAARRAGKKPSWTLRDLIRVFSTEESFRHILQWHDTPEEQIARYFELSGAQQSSIFLTIRQCIEQFSNVANRWHDAQQRGRLISLKKWAHEGRHSVLLLPNTKANIQTYGPLNATLFKALTSIMLSHEYSDYLDENGMRHSYQRLVIIDEVGQAGRLELDRILSEGRSFGINVILGLHQLSQMRETYGEHVSETILGMCSNYVFLKAGDITTATWMSKTIGNCLRAYNKDAYTFGTTKGKTITTSEQSTQGFSQGSNRSSTKGTSRGTTDTHGESRSSTKNTQSNTSYEGGRPKSSSQGKSETEGGGTSESHSKNNSSNESETTGTNSQKSDSRSTGHSYANSETSSSSHTESVELRGEASIEPHEFINFPDPEVDGVCEGVYRVTSFPIWRVQISKDRMLPKYEFPEKLNEKPARRSSEDDERVTKSAAWTDDDLVRLAINSLPEQPQGPSHGSLNSCGLLDLLDPTEPPIPAEPPIDDQDPTTDADEQGSSDDQEDDNPLETDFDF